ACVKHYCLNNIEYARLFSSSDASERTMREIYLRQFEIAMRAKPWTVMCSYNAVGGTYMAENKKMFDILRSDLGFDGLIMSDWTAVKVESRSINAGLDLAMPYEKRVVEKLDEDYKNGLVDGDALNRCAANVVALAEKCESESKLRKVTLSKSEREQISKDIESEGIVLLKNNGVLPLNEGAKVLVTGAPERKYYTGGGSAKVTPSKNYVRLGSALNALGFDSCYRESARENVGGQMCMNGSMISCREEMKTRDVAIIEVGNPESCETECRDRQTIKLSREEEDIIKYISKFTENVIVVVYAGSAVDMSEWIDDVSAVVWAGFGGQCVNEAVAEVLAGKINPSGKLTETFPLSLDDVKAMHSYYDPETFAYQEGLFVGYRYFETENVPVLFPFGYGLSYSEFEYSNLSVKSRSDGGITAEFDVTNISDIDGAEIAELYIEGLSSESGRPKRELKGFAKKPVGAHRTEHYEIDVCADDLRYFSEKTNSWQMPHSTLSVMIGKNCRDIVLEGKIKI
ncbi:MAG: glycoside hydrolase family 3 protein, partial [Clostridiales bacterium]|nr:glycoside hydrolase family 3 protein [Clostridiales bacterium]